MNQESIEFLPPKLSSVYLSMQAYLSHVEACLPKNTVPRLAVFGLGTFVLYALSVVTYRLIFSPIAKFPGPKLAALTTYYELYYDVVHKGKYLFEIEKMHDKYGTYYSSYAC